MADQGLYMEGNWLNNESYPSASTVSWTKLIISIIFEFSKGTDLKGLYWRSAWFFVLSEVYLVCCGSELLSNSLLPIMRMNSDCPKVGF